MNQLKSIYNSQFKDSHPYPIHSCFPIKLLVLICFAVKLMLSTEIIFCMAISVDFDFYLDLVLV